MEASSIAVHAAKLVAANKADDVIKVTDRDSCCLLKNRSSSFLKIMNSCSTRTNVHQKDFLEKENVTVDIVYAIIIFIFIYIFTVFLFLFFIFIFVFIFYFYFCFYFYFYFYFIAETVFQ